MYKLKEEKKTEETMTKKKISIEPFALVMTSEWWLLMMPLCWFFLIVRRERESERKKTGRHDFACAQNQNWWALGCVRAVALINYLHNYIIIRLDLYIIACCAFHDRQKKTGKWWWCLLRRQEEIGEEK